ncbi:Mitomycin resistance protein mcrB [Candidatus Dependentiae bacterium]|nr:Mitomycin resistance protein mcrB [Candidatus Dependentiae bacterium]
MMKKKISMHLSDLRNVGKATLQDLYLLNIESIEQLAVADPDVLYAKLEAITEKHHDPCVWDVFAAIIHEACTGQKSPWWEWTKIRKQKEVAGPLCAHRKKRTL